MINRSSVILKYKEPAIKWINDSDPYNDDPGITQNSVNSDRTVYLVREEDADGPDSVRDWITLNFGVLFESELEGWYTDESLWPQDRTMELFNKWFQIECHSVILDTVGTPIEDEEI